MFKIPCLIVLSVLAGSGVCTSGQDSAPPAETLTLEQALDLAQQNNRQIKNAKQGELSANDQILVARTQRYPQFNVQLTGGALLTPVTVQFPQATFGNVNGSPVPSVNALVTTNPKFTGMAVAQAYQPLSQLYNIHLNIEALEVGKKLAKEQTRQQRQQITNSVKDAYYSLLQTQSALRNDPCASPSRRAWGPSLATALLRTDRRPWRGHLYHAAPRSGAVFHFCAGPENREMGRFLGRGQAKRILIAER